MKTIAISLIALLALATAGRAAEIQFRAQCQARGPLVTLGDVAQVAASDPAEAARLAAIDLGPAPAAGGQKVVRAREVQDTLFLRGVNLTQQRFSGANQCVVLAAAELTPVRETAMGEIERRRAQRVAQDAISKYLKEVGGEGLTVECTPADAQARLLLRATRGILVRGGSAPWTGSQRLELSVATADGVEAMVLEALVAPAATAVVTVHPLAKGSVVRADDVRLAAVDSVRDGYRRIEDVLGKELLQGVPEGRALDRGMLRAPVSVRRGDVVTVFARAAGIRIRTLGRAKDEGAVGDLIAVESIENRKSYYARVCGLQEVELFAGTPSAPMAAAGLSARR